MLNKRIFILLVVLAASGMALAADPPGIQVRATRPDASATLERSLAEGKSLVSVLDAKQEPVLGLTAKDFAVTRGDASAKITSVQPISQTVEVPRHVVLVLDNSDSMVARKAVPKLLEGVGAVLKAIRPVDDVRIVVFGTKPVKMGGRDLHVQTFQSSKPAELEAFVAKAYQKGGTTETTVLYEAMVAGLELIRGMPVERPALPHRLHGRRGHQQRLQERRRHPGGPGTPEPPRVRDRFHAGGEDRPLPRGLRRAEPRSVPESRDGSRSPDALQAVRLEAGPVLRRQLRVPAAGRRPGSRSRPSRPPLRPRSRRRPPPPPRRLRRHHRRRGARDACPDRPACGARAAGRQQLVAVASPADRAHPDHLLRVPEVRPK